MKTVSFQGTQLSAGQRRQLAFQQQAQQAFLNSVLQQQMVEAEARLRAYQDAGGRGENPNKFKLEHQSKGTPWLGDVFGF
ncbi:hypothetical protein D9M68_226380 [compost metagenome]